MRILLTTHGSAGLIVMCCAAVLVAADAPRGVTKVGEQTITAADVERELARSIPKLPDDAAVVAKLRAATLRECVNHELALQWFEAQGKAASEPTMDAELQRRKKELAARKIAWEKYLEQSRHTEASLRREVKWRLTWQNYLDEQLADANLQRYFDKHRAEFDGTKVRVAHLLLKAPESSASQAAWNELLEQAVAIRQQVTSGKLTFADAVKKHSQAPTAESGGDIGFIGRHAPMPEAFSKAAFALKSGETSAPVETTFGVHLIQCLEIKPGEKPWTESREELKTAVTRYLFDWIVEKQGAKVRVQYLDVNAVDDPTKLPLDGKFQ